MNCKHCNAELEENTGVCPYCGGNTEEEIAAEETVSEEAVSEEAVSEEAVSEEVVSEEVVSGEAAPVEKPAKKKKEKKPLGKGPKVIIAIALTLVLLLGLAAGTVWALGFSFTNRENNLFVKDRYTAPDFMASLAADTVVATLGDSELTNGMLQMYFGRALWDLVEEYGDYLTSMGLDLNKPLAQQKFPGADGATWEQYLLSMALGAWAQQQTLLCMAEDEDFQYPEGMLSYLDTLETLLDEQATENGYKDGNALVKKEMGASANVERYKVYSEIYNKSLEYYAAYYENVELDSADIEAYWEANAETIQSQYDVTKDANPVIDVRHILLMPKADTEESKAVCLRRAEELLQRWKDGEATEESFAALANEHSEDPGSNTNGGLYEYVYQGDMVDTFNDWCFDESRKPGDTGIVETDYGYHLMYFVYGADEWYRLAEQSLRGEKSQEMVAAGYEKYPSQVYFHKIMLSAIDFE